MDSDIRIRTLPPQADDADASFIEGLNSMLPGDWQGVLDSMVNRYPKYPPLDVLPCANVNMDEYSVCKEPGKMACSSCRLVSYCSKKCQKAHWKIHKSDCEDTIRSTNWEPGWVVQHRAPSFLLKSNMSSAEEFSSRFKDKLSTGVSLWGNVPAMDIVNLLNNEKDPRTNLSLAFTGSGDLRNVVATINALGSDYSGKLDVLINDIDPHVVSRNITLLLILGMIPDEVIAADIALHFWYSLFIPIEYRFHILSTIATLLKNRDSADPILVQLGPRSTLNCLVTPDVEKLFMDNVDPSMSPDQAQDEYRRVRTAPSRVDLRDRMYMGLKPSHRLAFLEYRRFGIILPFGAVNAHFNVPNPSLFSDGVWSQTDYADPLESWDMDEVFSAGKAHGAKSEDVYGCLYFFLSDQLRTFARHIRQHRITFHVFSFEARALGEAISEGTFAECGIPGTTRFDRIDVSNLIDENYVGIRGITSTWGPLLKKTEHAALTGYLMNWAPKAEKGRVEYAGPAAMHAALDLMMKKNRIRTNVDPMLAVFLAASDADAFYDNYKPFSKFWKDHGGADTKLQLRKAHKIIPHRLNTAVDAKPDALPYFADEETWYRYTRITSMTWTERFIELCRKEV